jgi:hyperosmotically inducible periplasmic protein
MEGEQNMKTAVWVMITLTLAFSGGLVAQQEVSSFPAYVDSDLCARLMLGPVTTERIQCSQSTFKDGSLPVLVRLSNNMVFTVNNEKMLRPLVGQLAEASGEMKPKNGTMKLQDVKAITEQSIPSGDPARKLLDVRTYKTDRSAQLFEKIRHELAMLNYISEFDFISFTLAGSDVILTGWTVRDTNRDDAYRAVKDIKGVESVVNNIDVLPLGSFDMQIRAGARAVLQRFLSRYFWGSGSDIKIIVKNGQLILLGTVSRKSDSDLAFVQCNALPGVFKVFNLLRVQSDAKN